MLVNKLYTKNVWNVTVSATCQSNYSCVAEKLCTKYVWNFRIVLPVKETACIVNKLCTKNLWNVTFGATCQSICSYVVNICQRRIVTIMIQHDQRQEVNERGTKYICFW